MSYFALLSFKIVVTLKNNVYNAIMSHATHISLWWCLCGLIFPYDLSLLCQCFVEKKPPSADDSFVLLSFFV
jgi:hypothetical protein